MPRRILILGTDTAVGKTWVAAGLVRALVAADVCVSVFKPFESGVGEPATARRAADAGALWRASGAGSTPLADVCPWPLPRPVTPAAELERLGIAVRWDEVRSAALRAEAGSEVLIIESAGGLLSPLFGEATSLDLARELEAETVLIARNRLGVISAARAAVVAMAALGVRPGVVVLNDTAEPDAPPALDNARWIGCSASPVVVLGSDPLVPELVAALDL